VHKAGVQAFNTRNPVQNYVKWAWFCQRGYKSDCRSVLWRSSTAHKALITFHPGFALDAIARYRSGFESFYGDVFSALFTDAEGAVFDVLQRLFDLPYEQISAVAKAFGIVTLHRLRSSIDRVRQLLVYLLQILEIAVTAPGQFSQPLVKMILKVFEVFFLHYQLPREKQNI